MCLKNTLKRWVLLRSDVKDFLWEHGMLVDLINCWIRPHSEFAITQMFLQKWQRNIEFSSGQAQTNRLLQFLEFQFFGHVSLKCSNALWRNQMKSVSVWLNSPLVGSAAEAMKRNQWTSWLQTRLTFIVHPSQCIFIWIYIWPWRPVVRLQVCFLTFDLFASVNT